MSNVLPQLRAALLIAAARGRPPRRPPLGVLVLALAIAGLALAAVTAWPDRGDERPAQAALVPVPAETLAKSRALARAPRLVPTGRRARLGRDAFLRRDALPAFVAALRARLPYPPGTADHYDFARVDGGRIERYLVEFVSQYRASCLWYRFWLEADAAGAAEAEEGALRVLRDIPSWSAFASATTRRAGDLARAAAAGSRQELRAHVDVNCTDPPEDGRARARAAFAVLRGPGPIAPGASDGRRSAAALEARLREVAAEHSRMGGEALSLADARVALARDGVEVFLFVGERTLCEFVALPSGVGGGGCGGLEAVALERPRWSTTKSGRHTTLLTLVVPDAVRELRLVDRDGRARPLETRNNVAAVQIRGAMPKLTWVGPDGRRQGVTPLRLPSR
jgi:hypothetical protein